MIISRQVALQLIYISSLVGIPQTSEYLQVVKMLIAKYPFLKDLEGNGYVSALANNYSIFNMRYYIFPMLCAGLS